MMLATKVQIFIFFFDNHFFCTVFPLIITQGNSIFHNNYMDNYIYIYIDIIIIIRISKKRRDVRIDSSLVAYFSTEKKRRDAIVDSFMISPI